MNSNNSTDNSCNICNIISNNNNINNNNNNNNIDNTEQKTIEQEETKLSLFDYCSKKSIDFLELNARNESIRSVLKKSLNIYCEYINRHLETLTSTSSSSTDSKSGACGSEIISKKEKTIESPSSSSISSVTNEESIEEKWKKCLYSIIVAIVRVLRLDFENPDNRVVVELVIYFYELLMVGFEFCLYINL